MTPNRRQLLMGAVTATGAVLATGCRPREAVSAGEVRQWDYTTDVLVVGSGGAGAAAAIEALAEGSAVMMLEKQPVAGGSTAMSGGVSYLGGGTPLQKVLGFADTVEDMYRYIYESGPPHPHADKLQQYCENSAEHFRWLVRAGVEFNNLFTKAKGLPFGDESLYYSGSELAWPWRDRIRPVPRGHKPGVKDHGGWKLMEILLQKAQDNGAKLMLNTGGERLIQDSSGRIVGIMATLDIPGRKSQKNLFIKARRGVVLCCGGFVHNRDMVRLYAPELEKISTPWGSAGDTGIGILMGIGVGAAAIRMNQALITIPLYPPENVLRGIVVNRSGQRFIAEDNYHCFLGHAVASHQDGKAWLLTDSVSSFANPDHRVSTIITGQTLESLETQAGFPVGALRHTVSYYNFHARNKSDPLLHKHPDLLVPVHSAPFTLYDLNIESNFTPHLTFGGLHTDIDSRVIDARGHVIPGLYAAGRTASGLPGSPYVASGISVGDAVYFGRRAGLHAATVKV